MEQQKVHTIISGGKPYAIEDKGVQERLPEIDNSLDNVTTLIANEQTRAKAAEKANADAIAAEVERAKNAEQGISSTLQEEVSKLTQELNDTKVEFNENIDNKVADVVDVIEKGVEAIKDGDTIAGQAREVYSRTGKTISDSFLVRTTAGSGTVGDGVASLKKIGGNIVKNLVDGTFESGWDGGGNKSAVENGIYTNLARYTTTPNIYILHTYNAVVGHKYYITTMVFNSRGKVDFNGARLYYSSYSSNVNNTWLFASHYYEVTQEMIDNNRIGFLIRVQKDAADADMSAYRLSITKPLLIDLTEEFGAGDEPSKEECDRLFGTMDALPQGLTIAKPTEFKSVGYNQFNPENVLKGKTIDENGAIVDNVGTDIAVIPCLPCKIGTGENNGYCVHGEFEDSDIKVYLTPLNPMEVDGELYMHELTPDATTNTYVPQIKGYMLVVVPTTANLCCHFLWGEDRDKHDYEPYHESKVALPDIPQMSEWGLAGIQSSGTLVCDEIDFERGVYVKKIKDVELSQHGWFMESEANPTIYFADLGLKTNGVQNALSFERYTLIKYQPLKLGEMLNKCMMFSGRYLYIRDDNYATNTDFRASLTGLYVHYAMATPEEYPLPKFDNNYISSDYGVEMFNSTVPCNANNLYYMRSLAGETRNFLDRMYDNTEKTDAKEVADYITSGIESNKELATNAPNLALRALFVAAGAEYNDTDSVKEVSVVQDGDLGGTKVQHLPNHYRLNSLGDITEKEMIKIYNIGRFTKTEYSPLAYLTDIRTNLGRRGQANASSGETPYLAFNATGLNTINLCSEGVYEGTFFTSSNAFSGCSKLRAIYGRLILNTVSASIFQKCSALERVKIASLDKNVLLGESPLISIRSVLYMIQNAKPTTAITITLHPDAYARLAEDAEIVAALEAQPLITLVSA